MMIQRFKWLGLMGLLALAGQTRVFAEEGAPSKSALAEMGLSSLSVMSDDEAMDIRGEGFKGGGSSASAWGSSWAFVSTPAGAAGSKNGYNAHGKNSASGDNLSFAGVTVIKTSSKSHGKPPKDGGGNGGYGGNKMSSSKGSKGGNGGYGGGGGDKGGHGGKTTTTTFIVFAGGSSHAHAH